MEIVKILKAIDIINDSVSEYEGVRPFLSTGDLNLSTIINLELHTFLEKPSRANLNVSKGDIILARMQGTVKVKVIENEDDNIIVSTGFLVLRPKINADNKFLFHLLKSSTFQNKKDKLCTGATQKAINNSNFEKLEIPLPPLATQQKIAAILDQASAIITNNQAIVEKYDTLTQSLFLEMFGDPVKNEKGWDKNNCRNILKVIGGGVFKSSDYVKNGIPLIRIGSVNKGYFDDRETVFIPETYIKTHKKYLVYPNDLLITLTGTVGKNDYGNVFKLGNDYEKYYLNQRVAKFEINKTKIDSVFFEFYLKQNEIKKLLTSVSRGVRQANISNEDIYNLEIILPSINLQNQFAERVQAIEVQKQQAQLVLSKSEELFTSLLQKAFKGELN
jgi:type I restriction enzyme S subunit